MATQLLLAPVGAGKTESALERILERMEAAPFAPVWVLLATERQIAEFRSRLIAHASDRRVLFNVEFFTFYDLYSRLLDAAGKPTRQLGDAAQLRLLRALLSQLVEQSRLERVYAPIADKPGFVSSLSSFIYELKQNLIEPHHLEEAATALFEKPRAKDQELLAIYREYQARLQKHDIVDREGEGWLALAEAAHNPVVGSDVQLLVVDGYDQFTNLQAELIARLSSRISETFVTLTVVPDREATVGRRFQEAQVTLQEAHQRLGVDLRLQAAGDLVEMRHRDLQYLADQIFRLDVTQTQSTGGIAFVEAADPAAESEAVLRRVKRLLLDQVPPDEILIVLRDYSRYRPHLQALIRQFDLPIVMHLGEPLGETPPVRALLDLLTLHDERVNLLPFSPRQLLDVLRSPYFSFPGLGAAEVDLLDRISRRYSVLGGPAMWLEALTRAAKPRLRGEDEDAREEPPLLASSQAEQLKTALTTLFNAVTPPSVAAFSHYLQWLESLIGGDDLKDPEEPNEDAEAGFAGISLNILENVRRYSRSFVVSRDLAALNALKDVLRGLQSAQELLVTLEGTGSELTWEAFFADLLVAIEHHALDPRPERTGRVLVTAATDARGLPHDYVFVMGLSEGIFPRPLSEDPFYLDRERSRFVTEAGLRLETLSDRTRDDGLFYELVSLARRQLTLSRPVIQDGAPWVESYLWRESVRAFSDADQIIQANAVRIGSVTPLDDAITQAEVALAVSEAFTQPSADVGAYQWLLAEASPVWKQVRLGRGVEMSRAAVSDQYDGVIAHPDLLATIAMRLGPDHRWSASQLHDYGMCPFRFFAARILQLETLESPEQGMDSLQIGSLNHRILEMTYRELAAEHIAILPTNTETAIQVLRATAPSTLEDAPEQFGFRATSVWAEEQQQILKRLEALVRFDFDGLGGHLARKRSERISYETRYPFAFEVPFTIEHTDPDGETLAVTGYIDRVDRLEDGSLLVMDYKTGSTDIRLTELASGRNFQIMLYVLAAERVYPDASVRGGFFLHIRSRKASGVLLRDQNADLIDAARQRIGDYVHAARRGRFPVEPSKLDASGRCASYCEFYRLCRIAARTSS